MAHSILLKVLCAALLAFLPAWGALVGPDPALALSARQVLDLRKAGVSDETIRQMIETEIAVARRGGTGTYINRTDGGREYIVYYASSPGGVDLFSQELGAATPAASQALGASRGRTTVSKSGKSVYALHLASFSNRNQALQKAVDLTSQGVAARVEAVDLPEKGRWYRILTGRYSDKAQAQAQGEKLQKAGSIGRFAVIAFETRK
jgi:hypothetical protein